MILISTEIIILSYKGLLSLWKCRSFTSCLSFSNTAVRSATLPCHVSLQFLFSQGYNYQNTSFGNFLDSFPKSTELLHFVSWTLFRFIQIVPAIVLFPLPFAPIIYRDICRICESGSYSSIQIIIELSTWFKVTIFIKLLINLL